MLDSLLALSKKDRNKILKGLELETKKHIFNNIYTMTEELGLDKIDDFETRVKMRHELINKFPDTVFWDYVEYASINSPRKKDDSNDFEKSTTCKVSTNGDFIILSTLSKLNVRLYIHTSDVKKRYKSIRLNDRSIVQHRAVASTFIPKPKRFKNIHYKDLQVNHLDLTKYNNKISNLEWVTGTENIRHRHSIGVYQEKQYFLFEVAVDNGFLGRQFILSEDELHLINSNFTETRKQVARSLNQTYKGFKVVPVLYENRKNIPIGFPKDILELFNKDSKYFNTRITPIIGTVLCGKYEGFEFSLFGGMEIDKYFNHAHTKAVALGIKGSHKNCIFRNATHKEAIPLHGKLTSIKYLEAK